MDTATLTQLTVRFPMVLGDGQPQDASTGFSVDAEGTGSFTGLAYSIPAHASGTLKAEIQVESLTTQNIADLNTMVLNLLSASERDKVTSHQETHVSADLGFFELLAGGVSASYSNTTDSMKSLGLTDDQITQIIDKMFDIANKMSHVELDFQIDNTANDYSVDGDLELWTISGKITSSKGDAQYRMLASKGSAGNGSAPAQGKIIPLN